MACNDLSCSGGAIKGVGEAVGDINRNNKQMGSLSGRWENGEWEGDLEGGGGISIK